MLYEIGGGEIVNDQDLVNALREHAEWARANEWETPITLGDDLAEAADRIERLTARCARYAEEIAVAQERTRWIPVTERLPELQSWGASTVVLGLIKNENAPSLNKLHDLTLCVYCDNGIWSMPGRYAAITHWMPLPEPPKEVEPEEVLPKDKADEIALKLMRLADLENICSYTRLRELAEADKDSRLVVLPCKVGDTVYYWDGCQIIDYKVESFSVFDGNEWLMYGVHREKGRSVFPLGLHSLKGNGIGFGREFWAHEFYYCKTVFLTREEAEEALEAKKK